MTAMHKDLASGRWNEMPFCEQMANIGSEVNRAFNWHSKGKLDYSEKALMRAFDLLDLTINANRYYSRLKELMRIKEGLLDFYYNSNKTFNSTEEAWKKYFLQFAHMSRQNR